VHKFLALEELFVNNPELAEDIVMVQVAQIAEGSGADGAHAGNEEIFFKTAASAAGEWSTRTPVTAGWDQVSVEDQVLGMVSRINSKLQSVGEDGPIQYIVQGSDMPPEQLAGLFAAADVLICTPIRDGINTTPFEYLVCREALGELGVVVLSEFAGCAHSLSGAILTNPWDSVRV
jgi:trehalose 6-phosphate synthase/phosphatase